MTLIPAQLREDVVHRAAGLCEYCRLQQEYQVATFPLDHVMPVVAGGLTISENLALACPQCNARKWTHIEAVDPQTGQLVSLFNPRTEPWANHFRWSNDDATLIEPITPTARATVLLLELNSDMRRAIRRLLIALGKHPPR